MAKLYLRNQVSEELLDECRGILSEVPVGESADLMLEESDEPLQDYRKAFAQLAQENGSTVRTYKKKGADNTLVVKVMTEKEVAAYTAAKAARGAGRRAAADSKPKAKAKARARTRDASASEPAE
jgi:hypothetical protein